MLPPALFSPPSSLPQRQLINRINRLVHLNGIGENVPWFVDTMENVDWSSDEDDNILNSRARKRRRVEHEMPAEIEPDLGRRLPTISPPRLTRPGVKAKTIIPAPCYESSRPLSSPIQLTSIRDLSAADNADTVTFKDLVGDPLIKECWHFNYLTNVDFVMYAKRPARLNITHLGQGRV